MMLTGKRLFGKVLLLLVPLLLAAAVPVSSAPAEGEGRGNVFPFPLETLGADGLPENWSLSLTGEHAGETSFSLESESDGSAIAVIRMPRESSAFFDSAHMRGAHELKEDTEYILTVTFKVEDMRYTGPWYDGRPVRGILVTVFGRERLPGVQARGSAWMSVNGEGGTDGWVTMLFPFSSSVVTTTPRLLIRMLNMSGTVRLRTPFITEKPSGIELQSGFEDEQGRRIASERWLRLSR